MLKISLILLLVGWTTAELYTPYPFNDNFCGIMSQSAGLIYGGKQSMRSQFPWIAIISVSNDNEWSFKDSGSLISHRHVLTSARAVSYLDSSGNLISVETSRVNVYLGTTKYDNLDEMGSLKASVGKISNHPYAREALKSLDVNKVSIITLDFDVIFTEFIRPVCLWPFSTEINDIAGREAYAVGYGEDHTGESTLTRKHARVTIQGSCGEDFKEELQFQNETRLFCAMGNGEETPCLSDSQLYIKVGPNWFVKGILSTLSLNDNGTCDAGNSALYEDIERNVIAVKWLMV